MNCQQHQLYEAEYGVPKGRIFASLDEVQEYYDALRDTAWWERLYPMVKRVEVGPARKNANGSVGSWFPDRAAGRCEFHPAHRDQLVVLHELAHVLAAARYTSQAHCPWFARVYLEIVSAELPESYVDLYDAFQLGGIDFDIPDEHIGGIAL